MTIKPIEVEIDKTTPHTVDEWIEVIVSKGFSKPTEIIPMPAVLPPDCEMCDDTEYTQDGEKCLCHYEKLNEDGHEF